MKTIEYRFIDKAAWGPGEWQDEPDKVQWEDAATCRPCLAVRTDLGHLCGYVGVAEHHPAFGRGYDSVAADVHGGLTFSGFCVEDDKEHGICHVPADGESDRVWWLGFDCAHGGDASPGREARYRAMGMAPQSFEWHAGAVYRTLAYVKSECASLARQLSGMAAR